MTRRVLTTIGSVTAIATAVGACLLLGPTPQAQAGPTYCDATKMNCVTFNNGGGFTATKITSSGTSTGTVSWNPFCLMVKDPSASQTYGC